MSGRLSASVPTMEETEGNMLSVRGAYKQFAPSTIVLNGLDMTARKGCIYGLLGASGCGKTTLLNCIAGQLTLDAGSISVHILNKLHLGYMPQNTALQESCTVSEMLTYFGKLFGLSADTITKRGLELLDVMELPPSFWNRVIADMSGGQQRRVSLLVTLLHDPELIILDEPTVGLDPLLCEKLWTYFLQITELKGKTVILTTHYIEESRRAHTIGLMRCGVILTEAAPSQLLSQFNCDALEDVFLLLSQKQCNKMVKAEEVLPHETKALEGPLQSVSLWEHHRIAAEIYRNSCSVKRNISMLVFTILLPALMVFIFCIMCDDNLHSVVITTISEEVYPDVCFQPIHPGLKLPLCEQQAQLSCRYIQLVRDRNYEIEEHLDYHSAYRAVENGRAHAMLYFKRNYSLAVKRRVSDLLDTPDEYVNSSIIKIHLDRSDVITSNRIAQDLIDIMKELLENAATDCGYNPRVYKEILQVKPPIFGDLKSKFSETAFPTFLIAFVFYTSCCLSSEALGSEKASGFLDRCQIAGVQKIELVLAQSLVHILTVVSQNTLLLALAYGIFNMPLKGSWWLILSILGMAELQGLLCGFLLATVCDSDRNVAYVCIGIVLFLFSSCGMYWPVEGAHWTIRSVFQYFPVLMAVESYRSVTVRGWTITDKNMAVSLLTNFFLIVFLVVLFVITSKVKK